MDMGDNLDISPTNKESHSECWIPSRVLGSSLVLPLTFLGILFIPLCFSFLTGKISVLK